ncbi:DUF982 domain-containing protein [Paracoccus yeei]|uniref:DUF982 domain-containing protein n=1 Tax=Paracoccus yeei TaxID=147645 RepID=A0A1V0GUU5_9RHOB|nr:DUF982 domain-containing protein [Paracoccus yeei]ARC37560.1 DUF982 domain-containing protein [Paracoccus yeei]
MFEIYWGKPFSLTLRDGTTQDISTAEQARHWLKRKWPTGDSTRQAALAQIEAAMECLVPVAAARQAFATAARNAGLLPTGPSGQYPRHLAA